MKLGFGISIAVILLGLSVFSSASYVYSATTTPTVISTEETETPSAEATPTPEALEGYEEIAAKFFETLAEEDGEAALTYAFSTNPYSSRVEDQLNVVINQLTSAEQVMGEYVDYELLVETKVADRLVLQYYLVIYERQPLKFELTFYKPQDKWAFQNFVFNGEIIEDISVITRLSLADSEKVTITPSETGAASKDMAYFE